MSGVSAYAIGERIWIVATEKTADENIPRTLPMGSLVLTEEEAKAFTRQLGMARAAVRNRMKRKSAA